MEGTYFIRSKLHGFHKETKPQIDLWFWPLVLEPSLDENGCQNFYNTGRTAPVY